MFTTNWHEKSNAPLPTFYGEEGARLPNRRLLASEEHRHPVYTLSTCFPKRYPESPYISIRQEPRETQSQFPISKDCEDLGAIGNGQQRETGCEKERPARRDILGSEWPGAGPVLHQPKEVTERPTSMAFMVAIYAFIPILL